MVGTSSIGSGGGGISNGKSGNNNCGGGGRFNMFLGISAGEVIHALKQLMLHTVQSRFMPAHKLTENIRKAA
jgi:hypothetical protein